jgi:hypothetical protein
LVPGAFALFTTAWYEELDGPAVIALRRAIAEVKQRWSVIGWVSKILLSRASEGTLSRWSRLHLQSLPPTNPHSARVSIVSVKNIFIIYLSALEFCFKRVYERCLRVFGA